MIVALGALQGDSQKSRTYRVHDVCQPHPAQFRTGPLQSQGQVQESQSDSSLRTIAGIPVPGNLFSDKAIIRSVLIEGTNHVVAIAPQLWTGPVHSPAL